MNRANEYKIVDDWGYSVKVLYVNKRYESLKEENMNYLLMDLNTYDLIINKANINSKTNIFKKSHSKIT